MLKRKIEKLEKAIADKKIAADLGNFRMVINASAETDEEATTYETLSGEPVTDPKLIDRLTVAYQRAISKGEIGNITVSFDDYTDGSGVPG